MVVNKEGYDIHPSLCTHVYKGYEHYQICIAQVVLTSSKLEPNGHRGIPNTVTNARFKRGKELKHEIMKSKPLNGQQFV